MAGVDEPPRGHDIPKQKELLVKDSRKESRSTRRRRLQIIRSEGESSAAGKYTPDHKHATYQKRSSVSDAEMRPCLSHGSASIIGRRREMEDAVKEAPGFSSADSGTGGTLPLVAYDFFGVYDGHCGASVASACRDRLHVVLAEEVAALGGWPRTEEQWKEVMAACFTRMDGETEAMAEAGVGSTALVAVVGAEHIVVANCGDSRAVLSRGGVAVPLSSDHKPDRPDEMERVEAAGGRVVKWDAYRVEGVLATSRSIGDHYLKPFVISEPEVTVTSRTEEDELLILACDGLWDVVSSEMACRLARKCLGGQLAKRFPLLVTDCSAAEAAVFLAELAYARGSKDNISVVVVEL